MLSADEPTARSRVLVLGATGLLGQAMIAEARERRCSPRGAARSGAELSIDVCDLVGLAALVREERPSLVVNCTAITSHAVCEEDPAMAYAVNARAPALLAELSVELGIGFVQISTDHFFTGDGPALHDESSRVRLLNEYARTKYAGEKLALTAPAALAVRTNIVGLRRWAHRQTFAEWALDALEKARPITLYDDFFTSSMHSRACAKTTLDLVAAGATGLVNVASSEVSSKRTFVEELARAAGIDPPRAATGSVSELAPRRAESLGLDVSRAQRILGRRLPGLRETVAAIVAEHEDAGRR